MTPNSRTVPSFAPGEVLALLTPLQDIEPGLYLLLTHKEGWVVLRELIDDEASERILLTDKEVSLPTALLRLFMSIGLRMALPEEGHCGPARPSNEHWS